MRPWDAILDVSRAGLTSYCRAELIDAVFTQNELLKDQ